HLWIQETAVVPRSFERHRNFAKFKLEQVVVVDLKRPFDLAFDPQPPVLLLDLRNRKMRSNIKQFRRRDETVEVLERHLEIERIFAAHNLSIAKLCCVSSHYLGRAF